MSASLVYYSINGIKVESCNRCCLSVACSVCDQDNSRTRLWMLTKHDTYGQAVTPFLSLFWGGTRSLCMPALRPASQAGPMCNPREGTSFVLRDTIRLT